LHEGGQSAIAVATRLGEKRVQTFDGFILEFLDREEAVHDLDPYLMKHGFHIVKMCRRDAQRLLPIADVLPQDFDRAGEKYELRGRRERLARADRSMPAVLQTRIPSWETD
jgi:hypothetical protein